MDDPYDRKRFVLVQKDDCRQALSEIARGRKRPCWMWFVFPQVDGLGSSPTSRECSVKSLEEAAAYLGHPILGPGLVECAEAVLRVEGRSAAEIVGYPDDLKLRSCATLFRCVSPPGSVFDRVLEKYFAGEPDTATLRLVRIDRQERVP